MAVTITHTTPADGTFSATGAAAWDANHAVSGLGTMAEQDANNVNITGGSITGVTGVLSSLTVNSTPTSGGAAGQIMFDTGSVLQESSNLVWDNTNKKLNITGATVTASQPVLDMTQTWNNAATLFTGLKFNVTNTASNGSSLLMDLQIGGATVFQVGTASAAVYSALANAPRFGVQVSGDSFARVLFGVQTDGVPFFGFGPGTSTRDVFVSRKAAANLRFGAADAAAPVAQTLSVQSVVAGTSNTAGANLTITGSQGTGTGAGGSIIFQVAPAGSSGTAQNALSTALTINADRSVTAATSLRTTTTLTGGTEIISAAPDLSYAFSATPLVNYEYFAVRVGQGGSGELRLAQGMRVAWTSAYAKGTIDLFLTRRGAANLRFGNEDAAAPVAQTLSVQSVVAGTSNTAGANLTITGSQGTGTGAGGSIIFQTAPAGSSGTAQNALVTKMTLASNGNLQLTNSIDIGFDIYAGRYITLGSGLLATIYSGASGVIQLSSGASIGNGFNRLQFGGATSSFPALKRSSTDLQVRLADDSGYTTMDAQHRLQGTAPASATATGTAGDIRYDADYIYICTATNTWKRVAIATWP